jgi:hypothetical protein
MATKLGQSGYGLTVAAAVMRPGSGECLTAITDRSLFRQSGACSWANTRASLTTTGNA